MRMKGTGGRTQQVDSRGHVASSICAFDCKSLVRLLDRFNVRTRVVVLGI